MTNKIFTGPEKRAYLRVPSRCAINYTKLSKNLRPLINMITKSHTEDICANGVKLIVRKKIQIHTILEFRLRIPGTGRNIAGLGEVVRINPRSGGKSYEAGFKFLRVQRKDAELIDAYVRKKRIQEVIKKLRGKSIS